ncbi:hypothetical protein G7Y89_g12750 [Cudoniella acicularis]|uniref:Protein kinase domain-containing protein n=1 Tax=Cudoniella acicularis TaxID=354080 RepID=A0A8H4R8I6_9HELO|nr:hypothetical protein G7Y89_g12750 [Cudoniella acicularis]
MSSASPRPKTFIHLTPSNADAILAFSELAAAVQDIENNKDLVHAAKSLLRDRKSHQAIAKEIEILKSLPIHPQILRFREVHYERQDQWFSRPADERDERHNFEARPEKVVIIFSPFARQTMFEFFDETDKDTRLAAFQELLQGVLALHNTGFIHRDIKSANWGVVTIPPAKITTVILDYGLSIRATSCPRGRVGTVPFMAPEMEVADYGSGVDIWSCGIIGLQLFVTEKKLSWSNVTDENGKRSYINCIKQLRAEAADTMSNLIFKMLAWDPSKRITAEEALRHPCFAAVQFEPEPQPGQKRRAS